jgi:hypothetical protein
MAGETAKEPLEGIGSLDNLIEKTIQVLEKLEQGVIHNNCFYKFNLQKANYYSIQLDNNGDAEVYIDYDMFYVRLYFDSELKITGLSMNWYEH